MPNPPPPPGSCDCQFHIYGDPTKYPPGAAATYPPIDATFQDAVAMHRALGFERGVIVHSSVYGSDHRLLLDTLENLDPATRKRYRATSIIDDSVSDNELERLDAAGAWSSTTWAMSTLPWASTSRSAAGFWVCSSATTGG